MKWAGFIRFGWLCAAAGGVLVLHGMGGCGQAPAKPAAGKLVPGETIPVTLARREGRYIRLPVSVNGPAAVSVEAGDAEFLSKPEAVEVLFEKTRTGRVSSPAAEQLLGDSNAAVDTGSELLPAEEIKAAGNAAQRTFRVADGQVVWLHVNVPVTAAAGHHPVTVELRPAAGGKGPAAKPASGGGAVKLDLDVSDVTLPEEPPVAVVATTTTAELEQLDGAAFGTLPLAYLDRNEADQKRAVARLDALVAAAHQRGVALFVEDIGPGLKLDNVGQVHLDWDAYDRTMFPYMDGSAFADHMPLTVWVAPAPPRRIRETPAQLRQYWQECLDHLREKNWKALPILLHPALLGAQSAEGDVSTPELRGQILEMMRRDVDKGAAVLLRPMYARGQVLERPCFWVPDDIDRQLPPVGALATAASVRVWPWMCQAREVRGVVWRHAVGRPEEKTGNEFPLIVMEGATVAPTLRLAWLSAGVTDSARMELVQRRSDPNVAAEIRAGIVGRTGVVTANTDTPMSGPAGYVYAGWPQDDKTWEVVPAMLDRLIEASDPGAAVKVGTDDLTYLATKMWLAQAHRPVARTVGYNFKLDSPQTGHLLEAEVTLNVENPIQSPVAMDLNWGELPGDFRVAREAPQEVGGLSVGVRTVRAAGHLDTLSVAGTTYGMQFQERAGGAILNLPVMLPIYRALPAHATIKIDGQRNDWPEDARIARGLYSLMAVDMRYANRVDLLAGKISQEKGAAQVRWTYDGDWVYAFIECPQNGASDDRTGEWPGGGPGGPEGRWWGSDGVQVQIAGGPRVGPGVQVIQIGIKPSGTVLVATAAGGGGGAGGFPRFENGSPKGPALRYAIRAEGKGYDVELAIPRKWLGNEYDKDTELPLWRVNILRHREQGHVSSSWSGPIMNDSDVGMMGLVTGMND